MAFPNVLDNFQHYPRSYIIACASTTVLMNFLVMFLLAVPKFSRKEMKCNRVVLFSLALCDLLYETTTTTLFLGTDSCKDAGNCQMLHFFYLALNLCTIFHIFVEIMQKTILDFCRSSHDTLPSRVCWSVSLWIAAFGVAYVNLKTWNGLLDVNYITFIDRFKAFGYMLLIVTFCSAIVVITLMKFCAEKPLPAMNAFQKSHPPEINRLEIDFAATESQRDYDLVFTCLFMAIFVAWCGWVALGIDNKVLKTIEMMKSFEVIRLAARIMNPLAILNAYAQ